MLSPSFVIGLICGWTPWLCLQFSALLLAAPWHIPCRLPSAWQSLQELCICQLCPHTLKKFASLAVWNTHSTFLAFTFPLFFSGFLVFSYWCQLLRSVTKRHFVRLVQDCWYLPPYAMLTLVSRNSLKMQHCAQASCACKPPWLLPGDPNPNWVLLWPSGYRAALVPAHCPTAYLLLCVWDL